MKKLLPLLLLSGCVSQWPTGSYTDLTQGPDTEIILNAVVECAASIVPNHAVVDVGASRGADALAPLMPVALSRQGLSSSLTGMPLTYVVASTGVDSQARTSEGAFIRVSSPQGTCSQYFTRDARGVLQSGGPVMVVLQ